MAVQQSTNLLYFFTQTLKHFIAGFATSTHFRLSGYVLIGNNSFGVELKIKLAFSLEIKFEFSLDCFLHYGVIRVLV